MYYIYEERRLLIDRQASRKNTMYVLAKDGLRYFPSGQQTGASRRRHKMLRAATAADIYFLLFFRIATAAKARLPA